MENIIDSLRSMPGFLSMKPATAQQVESAEGALQLRFSNDYREYVLACGAASFDGHELTGVCPSKRLSVVDVTLSEREYTPFIPAGWYVIEQLNIDGIVIWQSEDGSVYQTAPGISPQRIGESLVEYVTSSRKRSR